MSSYVISADVAVELGRTRAVLRDDCRILAPTLIRSQVLSHLYRAVARSEFGRKEADERLEYLRGLRMKLLGDRVLQRTAWKVAATLGWQDTLDAEYVALTELHADTLITLDAELARTARTLVSVAPLEVLF